MVVIYTPLILTKAADILKLHIDQMQQNVQTTIAMKIIDLLNKMQPNSLAVTASVIPETASATPITLDKATTIERIIQMLALDVYSYYPKDDETKVLSLCTSLKTQGNPPWFNFLSKRESFIGKQQGHLIETIPAVAIFVSQYTISHWQFPPMYIFSYRLVELNFHVILLIYNIIHSKIYLYIFLNKLIWISFCYFILDPLTQLMWAVTDEHSVNITICQPNHKKEKSNG